MKTIAGKSDSVKVLKLAYSIFLEGSLNTFRLKQENYYKKKSMMLIGMNFAGFQQNRVIFFSDRITGFSCLVRSY